MKLTWIVLILMCFWLPYLEKWVKKLGCANISDLLICISLGIPIPKILGLEKNGTECDLRFHQHGHIFGPALLIFFHSISSTLSNPLLFVVYLEDNFSGWVDPRRKGMAWEIGLHLLHQKGDSEKYEYLFALCYKLYITIIWFWFPLIFHLDPLHDVL